MREKKKSGLFCCGQNSKKLRFYRGVSYVALCLGIGGGLGWLGLENMAQAAVCFLPDCGDKILEFQGDANLSTQYCRNAGYTYYELGQCPPYYHQEVCPDNSHYLKCDAQKWCEDNGYNTLPEDCVVPQYADEQCLNGLNFYKQCKEDLARACDEENPDYVSECQNGWKLDDDELCSYSPLYGKCCNECEDYPYAEDDIPNGYQKGESCLACGDITKYKKELYDCAAEGFIQCDKGGQTGTAVCWRGDEKWYKECCAPCDDYPYLENQIPEGYVKGDSCDSCDGMKYKTKIGECAEGYEWKDESCKKSCDNTCSVGNILYSDHTCSSCKIEGKGLIGVVSYADGNKRLAIDLNSVRNYDWGAMWNDIPELNNLTSSDLALIDLNGKENTDKIVRHLGGTLTDPYITCYANDPAGTSEGEWYLPAAGELYASIVTNKTSVVKGLNTLGLKPQDWYDIRSGHYWSSSEIDKSAMWAIDTTAGKVIAASKGYTSYVRCVLAFEDNGDGTAKVCGNDYIYSCSIGENNHVIGSIGDSCANMYKSCACASGYEWRYGKCVPCDSTMSCCISDILNSDMTCTQNKVNNKTPIGVVAYINGDTRLAVNLVNKSFVWGGTGTDIPGLTNIISTSTAQNDFSGKSNTSTIVSTLGDTSDYAAGYCYNYTTTGTSKGDWYLPAMGELYALVVINGNITALNAGLVAAGGSKLLTRDSYHRYWSSSEFSSDGAWYGYKSDSYVGLHIKDYNDYVRCVLAF